MLSLEVSVDAFRCVGSLRRLLIGRWLLNVASIMETLGETSTTFFHQSLMYADNIERRIKNDVVFPD